MWHKDPGAKIFISYRRSDSSAIVDRICERLAKRYTRDTIFRDIDSIPVATNFHDLIRDELAVCDIALVIIGPHWCSESNNRLLDERDLVRREVEAALASGAAVVPVLVEGATFPDEGKLPPSLLKLNQLNATEVRSGKDFDYHISKLARDIDGILNTRGRTVIRFPNWASDAAIGLGLLAFVVAAILIALLFTNYEILMPVELAVVGVVSLCIAASCALTVGDAVAKRRISVSLAFRHPVVVSAGAGAFAFLLVALAARATLFLLPTTDPMILALRLRDQFISARDKLENGGQIDFGEAEKTLSALKKLEPENGHVYYYSGEIKRVNKPDFFTAKSCTKTLSKGEAKNLQIFQEDFYLYREGVLKRSALLTNPDTRSETCYSERSGYCAQRTAWIFHLLANDFYQEAMALEGSERLADLQQAQRFMGEALKYQRPEGGEGFDQCISSPLLRDKINQELGQTR
jgi:hypothetical protein